MRAGGPASPCGVGLALLTPCLPTRMGVLPTGRSPNEGGRCPSPEAVPGEQGRPQDIPQPPHPGLIAPRSLAVGHHSNWTDFGSETVVAPFDVSDFELSLSALEHLVQSFTSSIAVARHVLISFVSPGIQVFQPCHGSTVVSVGRITHHCSGVKVGAAFRLPRINDSLLIQPCGDLDGGRFGSSPLSGLVRLYQGLCFRQGKVSFLQACAHGTVCAVAAYTWSILKLSFGRAAGSVRSRCLCSLKMTVKVKK